VMISATDERVEYKISSDWSGIEIDLREYLEKGVICH
jgi:hypothetical protein